MSLSFHKIGSVSIGLVRTVARLHAGSGDSCRTGGSSCCPRWPVKLLRTHAYTLNYSCSHVVKSLKFGTQFPARGRNRVVDPGMELEGLSALEDRVYTTDALHTAPHHYIKVGRWKPAAASLVWAVCR